MPTAYRKQSAVKPFDQAIRAIETHEASLKGNAVVKDLDEYVRKTYGKYVQDEYGFEILRDIIYYRDWNNFQEFCTKLSIKTKSEGITNFKWRKAQRVVWNKYILPSLQNREPIRVYILKGRQIGFTTLIEAIIFKASTLHCDINANVIAHDKGKAGEIFNMYKLFLRTTPENLQPTRKLSNRNEVLFSNPDEDGPLTLESYIKIDTADNKHLGAASTLQLMHLSEFARYESINQNAREAIMTLFQTMANVYGTMAFLETTAFGEGIGKEFWDADNGFQKIFVPWIVDEDYRCRKPLKENELYSTDADEYGNEYRARELIIDGLQQWNPEKDLEWCQVESLHRLAWRRITLKQKCFGKLQYFHREYPLSPEEAFISSSVSALDTIKLHAMKVLIKTRNNTSPTYTYLRNDPNSASNPYGAFIEAVGGELKIFEQKIPGEIYFIGIDVGAGVGGDNSVIQVVKSDYTQVAIYTNQIDPDDLAFPAVCLAKIYNNAFITPEANAMGLATIGKIIKDLRYYNVYRRIRLGTADAKPQKIYGFHTSPKTKPALITTLNGVIKSGTCLIQDGEDKGTIDEAIHFVYDLVKNTVSAAQGWKDDKIMALALAVFSIKDELPRLETIIHDINNPPPGSLEYLARESDDYYENVDLGGSFGSVVAIM